MMITEECARSQVKPRMPPRRRVARPAPGTARAGDTKGMPAPPQLLKDLIEGTVDHHASLSHPDLQEVTIRWRGSFGYLIAWAGEGDDNDEQLPLCRIEYLGDEQDWGFALYDPATATYALALLKHRRAHRAPDRRVRHRRHSPPGRLQAVSIANASKR